MQRFLFTITCVMIATIAVAINTTLFAADNPPQAKPDALEIATKLLNAIKQAERENVKNEEAVFQVLDQQLSKLDADNLKSIQDSLDGFREEVKILLRLAKELLSNRDKIIMDAEKLNKLNHEAIAVYRNAAAMFEEKAKEEPFSNLKEDHLLLARDWRALANMMEKRIDAMASDTKSLSEGVYYIERTELFLELLLRHLSIYPNLKDLAERDQYREQMRHYINVFERFREQIRKFDGTLRSDAISAELRPAGSGPHPADVIDKHLQYAQVNNGLKSNLKAKPAAVSAKKSAVFPMPPEDETIFSHSMLPVTLVASLAAGLLVVPVRRRIKRPAHKTPVSTVAKREIFHPGYVAPRPEPPTYSRDAKVSPDKETQKEVVIDAHWVCCRTSGGGPQWIK